MGDIADMMLDGTLCEGCGVYLEGGNQGFPRLCHSCAQDRRAGGHEIEKIGRNYIDCGPSLVCSECNKRLKTYEGLLQHQRDKHGN